MNPSLHPRAGNLSVLPARGFQLLALFACWLAGASVGRPATITENFATNPLAHGWQAYGNTNLFRWNSTNQNLAAIWDSAQTNSFFYQPLGTILARSDDFGFAFDLQLTDIAIGVNPTKTNTFELVVGFINLTNAIDTNLWRGAGTSAAHGGRNVCEFDYFPDSGYGATISPTILSSNNQFATSFAFPLTLDPGAQFHIAVNFTASNKTLHTTMTRNGQSFGPITDTILGSTFKDFRLNQFAVCSYSDIGADGSLLAHGTVDNFVITLPPPPVQNLKASFTNNAWTAQFISRSNWLYTLERTTNFVLWNSVSISTSGNGTNLFLPDTNAPLNQAFYRVRAERP
jgi:hypothetical protein